MHLQVYIFPVIYSPFLIPPPPKLSEFHARGGRGLQRVAPEIHIPPAYRKRHETVSQTTHFPRAKRKSRPCRWDFARAKRRSAARRLSQSKAEKRRPATFPEQSGKVWPAGASPEQSGKARARRLSQSKARKPATGLSQSKAEKRRPRARPETFAEQSAKPGGGRFRAGKCESGSGPPPGPPSRASYIARKAKTAPPGLSQTTQKVRGLLSGLFGPAE